MNILFVASEMAPYAKTGGLGDVTGALPRYLRNLGHDVRVFLPLYDRLDRPVARLEAFKAPFTVQLGMHRYQVALRVSDAAPGIYFVDCPALYHRGRIYTQDHDEHRRFLALTWAALMGAQLQGFAPDVIHCHDWQTGLLPLTLKAAFGWDRLFERTRTLLTIHNLGYQGSFGAHTLDDTNLRPSAHLFHQDQLHRQDGGRINHLLHGLLYADGITTVSPNYAREIQTPAHGVGLDGLLRARKSTVMGVLNGIDPEEWSPERDTHLPHAYSAQHLEGKAKNRHALLQRMGLPHVPGVPLLGVVSRLVYQKGLDLLCDVAPEMLARGQIQLVVLGNGEGAIEGRFAELQHRFPKQVSFYRGFSNPLAHLIEAGTDVFVMPSRYEPCGLNQMYSLRYGTVPVVHHTGGLADTVQPFDARTDSGTGFVFEHHDAMGLRWALQQAVRTWHQPAVWRRLMLRGMAQDFTWDRSAGIYHAIYNRLAQA